MNQSTSAPIPVGTNQHPYRTALPFNPDSPFSTGGMGVLCNSGSVAAPDASTYRHLVSSGSYNPQGCAAGDLEPLVNPTNQQTGNYWVNTLDAADFTLIKPYLVLYSDNTYAALASAASAAGITGTMSFYALRQAGRAKSGRPIEWDARYLGKAVLTNAATRVPSTTKELPTGAQWCDVATITSKAITFTADSSDTAGGALRLRLDHEGASRLLTVISGLTANAGCGWQISHM